MKQMVYKRVKLLAVFFLVYGIVLFVYVRIPGDMVNVSDSFIDFVFFDSSWDNLFYGVTLFYLCL